MSTVAESRASISSRGSIGVWLKVLIKLCHMTECTIRFSFVKTFLLGVYPMPVLCAGVARDNPNIVMLLQCYGRGLTLPFSECGLSDVTKNRPNVTKNVSLLYHSRCKSLILKVCYVLRFFGIYDRTGQIFRNGEQNGNRISHHYLAEQNVLRKFMAPRYRKSIFL